MGINVIIRPVSSICNLSCRYCYTKLEPKTQKRSFIMSDTILRKCIEGFMNSGHKHIKFLWHGGEPLLAGLDFFRRVLEIQTETQKRLGDKVVITNSLQTNGTLLNSV